MGISKLARALVARGGRMALMAGTVTLGLAGITGQASAQNLVTDGNFATGVGSTSMLTNGQILGGAWTVGVTPSQSSCVVDGSGNMGSASTGCRGFFGSGSSATVNDPASGTLLPYYAVMVESSGSNSLTGSVTLAANSTYTLSFVQAAGESWGTSDSIKWTVNLGGLTGSSGSGCSANSCTTVATSTVGNGLSSAWVTETYTFSTTSAVTENLQFIAGSSNPSGPPIALLDTISIIRTGNSSAPEPASLAVLGVGLAGLVVARRRRANANRDMDGAAA